MKKILIIFIFISVFFSSCLDKKPSFIIHNKTEVAEIPFEFSSMGHIVTKCIIKGNTFNFVFDTGADLTLIAPYVDDDGFLADVSGVDIHQKKGNIKICKLKILQCADIEIKNIAVGKAPIPIDNIDGIIGRDILKHFCVKIDNENKRILLSKKSNLITKKGVKEELHSSLKTIEIALDSNSRETTFLFDTGYVGEVSVNLSILNLKSIAERPKVLWEKADFGLFRDRKEHSLSSYFMSDIKLDTITFKNIVCEYTESINKNIIGIAFTSRFKSIVIDYLNGNVFFELPENNTMMNFSSAEINNASKSSLDLFFRRINSLGFGFSHNYPFVVEEIIKRDINSTIEIGDTLIGINNILFSEEIFNKSIRKELYRLNTDTIKQKHIITKVLDQSKEATFLFLKNNELRIVKTSRKNIFAFAPTIAYSFFDKNADLRYYAISYPNKQGGKFMFHIPYATLSGEEIKISLYKNGKEEVLSNNPKDINISILSVKQ